MIYESEGESFENSEGLDLSLLHVLLAQGPLCTLSCPNMQSDCTQDSLTVPSTGFFFTDTMIFYHLPQGGHETWLLLQITCAVLFEHVNFHIKFKPSWKY